MNIMVIGAATNSTLSPAISFCAATYASARQRLRRAASRRREALEHRLQEFVLELLAAIVLIAIIMVATDPATREEG